MRKLPISIVFFSITLIFMGCGDYPRSKVYGKITFNGQPLTQATIIFITKDNMTVSAELKADGSYEAKGVVRGPVSVSIQQALPRVTPRPDPTAPGAAKKGMGEAKDQKAPGAESSPPPPVLKNPIPSKYTDPKLSGLTFELKDPEQEWSIDLK